MRMWRAANPELWLLVFAGMQVLCDHTCHFATRRKGRNPAVRGVCGVKYPNF